MSMRKNPMVIVMILVQFLLIGISSLLAQSKLFSYQQIFERAEPRLIGELPKIKEWVDDSHYLEIRKDTTDQKNRLIKVNAATNESEVYVDYPQLNQLLTSGFDLERSVATNRDYSGFILNYKDDLYYFSTRNRLFKRLTATPAPEKNPKFSPDGKFLAYTRSNNLYAFDINGGIEYQLTQDGSETIYNGYASWVYYEEILGRESRYAAFWWAPNSEMIAFLRFDDQPVPTFPLFKADGAHGELEIQRYPKAGDPNPLVKLGIAHIKRNAVTWVDLDEKADQYVAWPSWTGDNRSLLFQWMNRGQDNIKIYAADAQTGQKKEIYDEKQPSWVRFFEDLYLLKDGSGFLLRTDVEGWDHLYYYDLSGKLRQKLTQGDWNVTDIAYVDEKNRMVYFHAANKAVERHLYRVNLQGKNLEPLTRTTGTHECQVSEAGSYFIDTFSNILEPSVMELYKTEERQLLRILGNQKLPVMAEYAWGLSEMFTIPADDGISLPALWVLPPNLDKSKKYPVIFEVYGGPTSATVADKFSSRTLLPYHYYAQRDIITITVDNRGAGHLGKKGMAAMHRNLGKWEVQDLITAVKWLRKLDFVDSTRIGITGGSYGGYTACMAMVTGADYFTHGVAEFSVTDWRLYDNVYTERFMDTPTENPGGYQFASVMTHAEKLKGKLLLIHGTMDDNVHMQNTIQLIDKLQDVGKDFEIMLYPNSRHGYGAKRGHAQKLLTTFWLSNFLGKTIEDLEK